jgi:hypothetical protein
MMGEMEKPLVIGKAAKARCFKNLKINNLSVICRSNKKTLMTAAAMKEWLNMFNAKMKKENRNAIFFLDNATCHPKVTLSNVKIAWFPANATSIIKPMDMGVIYTFKSHYKLFLMQSLISNVEKADSSYALARSVSVLDAVNWIGLVVKKIKAETVKKSKKAVQTDRLCGLVVRVPGYISRGLGSITGATRFSEKYWVWNGVHSAL